MWQSSTGEHIFSELLSESKNKILLIIQYSEIIFSAAYYLYDILQLLNNVLLLGGSTAGYRRHCLVNIRFYSF